jgi:hypothetical protein
LTKFVLLLALQSKRGEEIAYKLTDIFLTFGAPCILHSDNGRECVNSVIAKLTTLLPELNIVHGKPRHSQSQGSVERASHDNGNMLASWMRDNHFTNLSVSAMCNLRQTAPFSQCLSNRRTKRCSVLSPELDSQHLLFHLQL